MNIFANLIQSIRSIFSPPSNSQVSAPEGVEMTVAPIDHGDWMKHPGSIVYLLQQGERAFYKIGFTTNSTVRYKKLETNGPEPLREVHRIYTHHPEWLEKKWHARFAEERQIGSGTVRPSEWFKLTSADIEEFKSYPDWDEPEISSTQLLLLIDERDTSQNTAIGAVEQVNKYFDTLMTTHPNRVRKLEKARKYQISQFDCEVDRWKKRGLSRVEAIRKWEARAKASGKAKVDG